MVPFIKVNKETIGFDFDPTHLESEYENIRYEPWKQILNFVRLILHSQKKKDLFQIWIMLLKLIPVIENYKGYKIEDTRWNRDKIQVTKWL